MIIIIEGPPVAKGRPRFARRGKFVSTYTPAKTKEHENVIRNAGINAMDGQSPIENPLKVTVVCYMPIPKSTSKTNKAKMQAGFIRHTKKPDCDNLAKVVDSLNGIVWIDDSQIVRLVVTKQYSDYPRTEITIIEDID